MTIHPPRILCPNFEAALLSGILTPLLSLIKRDRDLIAEIRTDLLDVYCKGQRFISVERTGEGYRFTSHEKFWPARSLDVGASDAVAAFCCDVAPHIKHRIAKYAAQGKEIEFEQLLVRANNLEGLNTDYVAVDRQGVAEQGKGRTDVVGVYWPGDQRNSGNPLAPALIEVKYGLTGGVEDVAAQLARYFDDLATISPVFTRNLQAQLRQKARLGLLAGLSKLAQDKIQRLPISDRIGDVRAVIALVDYNPRSTRLDLDALRALPFAHQIDLFHLGFGLWRANSAFSAERPGTTVPPQGDGWLAEVEAGRFDAIPDPLRFADAGGLCHLVTGRGIARELGIGDHFAFSSYKRRVAEAAGRWEATAPELWLCLSVEHHTARIMSEEGVNLGSAQTRLLDQLCGSLRSRLLVMADAEKDIIVRCMSAKGWAVQAAC